MHDLAESQSINHSPLMNKKERRKTNLLKEPIRNFYGILSLFFWFSCGFLNCEKPSAAKVMGCSFLLCSFFLFLFSLQNE